jgi:amino acid transporter
MIKSEMAKRIWTILPGLVCLLLLGISLGFDYTKFRHWLILAGLGVVILSIAYTLKYIGKLVLNRYAARFKEWYAWFSHRPMNVITIFYVAAITLPIFLCLFAISGMLWSILSWFYRLFQV